MKNKFNPHSPDCKIAGEGDEGLIELLVSKLPVGIGNIVTTVERYELCQQAMELTRMYDSKPPTDNAGKVKHKLGDYDIWFKPCDKCGYDTAKASKKSKPNCWKCGRRIQRDYSDRALKKPNKPTDKGVSSEREALVLKMREVACDESECGDSYFEQFIDLCQPYHKAQHAIECRDKVLGAIDGVSHFTNEQPSRYREPCQVKIACKEAITRVLTLEKNDG